MIGVMQCYAVTCCDRRGVVLWSEVTGGMGWSEVTGELG
jgi:hypothetical protein